MSQLCDLEHHPLPASARSSGNGNIGLPTSEWCVSREFKQTVCIEVLRTELGPLPYKGLLKKIITCWGWWDFPGKEVRDGEGLGGWASSAEGYWWSLPIQSCAKYRGREGGNIRVGANMWAWEVWVMGSMLGQTPWVPYCIHHWWARNLGTKETLAGPSWAQPSDHMASFIHNLGHTGVGRPQGPSLPKAARSWMGAPLTVSIAGACAMPSKDSL